MPFWIYRNPQPSMTAWGCGGIPTARSLSIRALLLAGRVFSGSFQPPYDSGFRFLWLGVGFLAVGFEGLGTLAETYTWSNEVPSFQRQKPSQCNCNLKDKICKSVYMQVPPIIHVYVCMLIHSFSTQIKTTIYIHVLLHVCLITHLRGDASGD